MKAFMLDGFIDLSGFFDEFIKKNPVFSKSENVQFLIFNPDFTSIEYVHNSTASLARKEDFEAFTKLASVIQTRKSSIHRANTRPARLICQIPKSSS